MKISTKLTFYCEQNEFSGVVKIAKKVCGDVNKVLGFEPEIKPLSQPEGAFANAGMSSQMSDASGFETPLSSPALFFGTIGKASYLEQLEKNGVINLSTIRGKREVFGFFVTDEKIIIAGSDKRGTIYGLFHLSERMGVSPLVNWCDVLPGHSDFILLPTGVYVSKEPGVRFRGFFINDEWPAFGNWTNKRFGGFNSKMYEQVFELLLRMKGNYLWPAMWASRFSEDGPGLANAELADELGIIMGSSHHEPCCRAGEEYRYLRGKASVYGDAWNFRTNREGITRFWEDGLKRNGKFENVITVGMRGEADTAILKNATLADNINLLRDVIHTQNCLIKEHVNKNLEEVPRMLALYKEVEPYFYGDRHTKGLMNDPELEGVTLMLCDDNHGNLRTVPSKKMLSHKGGYGMYYHFDYHGSPYSYEWINSTALPKIKEQMCAAYDFGIRDLWIVNVGDVMTNEFPLNYFLDLAYDYETYSDQAYTTSMWTKEWIDFNFPFLTEDQRKDVKIILDTYTQLSHFRRPECLQPDTYDPVIFGEADYILKLAEQAIGKAEKLLALKDRKEFTGLFAQVIYPALGTMNVLRMQIYSGRNKWFAAHGCLAANEYAEIVKKCYAYDKDLVAEYDKIAEGKFYGQGWSEHFGFTSWCEAGNRYPTYTYVEPARKGRIVAWVEETSKTTTGQDWTDRNLYTTDFKNPLTESVIVYVAQCGKNLVDYKLSYQSDDKDCFIHAAKEAIIFGYGKKEPDPSFDRIIITIDRKKLAASPVKTDTLIIEGTDGSGGGIKIFVKIDAGAPEFNYPVNTYVQTDDIISIAAENFAGLEKGSDGSEWKILPDYGREWAAVKAFPVTKSYPKAKGAPAVKYDFVPAAEGVYNFDFYLNPSNPAYKDNKLQFMAEINGKKILCDCVDSRTFTVGDNQEPWGTDVTNNLRITSICADCHKGVNVLKIYPVTPNIVLEKIVIYSVNTIVPYSYLGAPETYRVK